MHFLLFLLVLQQTPPADDHGHDHSKENFLYFNPLSVGAVVSRKNFTIEIPEGTFYADEDNVPLMLPLTGAVNIPNCVGIFYSNSNNWNYSVVVQHYDHYPFTLDPELDTNLFIDFFKKHHLYRNEPFNGQADVVVPPTYQREENSFTLGMQYTEEDHTLVIIKKIYATKYGALVLSYKGNDEAFIAEPEAIDHIFNTISLDSSFNEAVAEDTPNISYLELLGIKPPTVQLDKSAIEKEGLDPKILVLSGVFALFGIALLLLAMKFRKS